MTATTTRAALRTRSRGLAPLAVVFLGVGLSGALSSPFLSLFLTSAVHAGPLRLSVFLIAQPLSGIAVSTVLGRLSDGRVARRRVLMACAVAGCTSAALFSVLRSYWPLLVLACTVTAVAASLMAQGFAYARAVLGDDPSAPMITSTLRTFFSLSWVAGPPLASLLLASGGFTTLYVCSAALYAVVLGVVALWLVEPVAAARRPQDDEIDPGTSGGARRSLWTTLVALALLQGAIWLNVQAIPLLVRHELHAGVGSAGVVLGVCAALEIPAMLGFGALSARVPLRLLIRLGPLFGIAYYAVAAAVGNVLAAGGGPAARRLRHRRHPGSRHQLCAGAAALCARSRLDPLQQHLSVRRDPRQPAAGHRCEVRLPVQLRRGGRPRGRRPGPAHGRSPVQAGRGRTRLRATQPFRSSW